MATKSKKDGGQRYDWEKIKADYITDPGLSLRKVAEKYSVPLRTIAEHSKADSWFATKKEHEKQYGNELATKLHQKKLDSFEQELMAAVNLSDRLYDVLMNDPSQFNRFLTTNMMTGETKEEVFEKIDIKSMKEAASLLKIVEDLKRSILGIERIENIHKHQIDAERLKLDQDKFEFEKQKSAAFRPAEGNVIRIEGFEEGWAK